MSDNAPNGTPNGTPTGGGDAKKWTEAEKYNLLLKIMAQLTEGGGKIQPAKLAMPNRTSKSLSHMVTAFRKEAAQLETGDGGGGGGGAASASGAGSAPVTPSKKRGKAATTPATGRKRTVKAGSEDEFDDAGSYQDTPTAKRQRRAAKTATPKKPQTTAATTAKVEDSDDDSDANANAKSMFPNLGTASEDAGI
ncbi:hypothetical protein F4809DRAFT_655454 [Biscogniauxia mediterranea]|nr:hypothetical protein F4809DRAFT_655454 [Biscogniauxia mediterranea]